MRGPDTSGKPEPWWANGLVGFILNEAIFWLLVGIVFAADYLRRFL
jgi:hypothetical protein